MAEKIPRASRCMIRFRPGARAFYKREASRQDRAAARRDPENAPTRRAYSGWVD